MKKMGILKPAKIDEKNGYRYYAADQVKQLDALLELRKIGFSLAEIQKPLEGGVGKERYMELLAHKKMMWREKIALAQERIHAVDEVIERLVLSRPPVTPHELTEDKRAALHGRIACLDVSLRELHGCNIFSEALWL